MELYEVMHTTFSAREFTAEPLYDKPLIRMRRIGTDQKLHAVRDTTIRLAWEMAAC
jgi:hypothetical protein